MDQSGQTGQPSQPPASGTPTSSRPFFAHHPTHTFTRDLGDVIVGGAQPPTKKRHTGIIIGIISLVVVIIVAIVVGIYIATQRSRIDQAQQSFAAYQRLLETGNQDNFNPESSWFIQTVAARATTLPDTYDSYTYGAMLQEKYDTFLADYQQLPEDSRDTLSSALQAYEPVAASILAYLRLGPINQSIFSLYASDGQSAVESYIRTILPSDANSTSVSAFIGALRDYFAQEAQIANIYSAQNCYADGELDSACVESIDVAQTGLDAVAAELTSIGQYIDSLAPMVVNSLKSSTQQLSALVEGLNE